MKENKNGLTLLLLLVFSALLMGGYHVFTEQVFSEKEASIEALHSQLGSIQNEVGAKRDTIMSLISQLDEKDADMKELKDQYIQLEHAYSSLDKKLRETSKLIGKGKKKLAKHELEKARKELHAHWNELTTILTKDKKINGESFVILISKKDKVIQGLEKKIINLENQIDNLVSQLAIKNATIERQSGIINRQSQRMAEDKKVISEMLEKGKVDEKVMKEYQAKLAEFENDNETLINQNLETEQKLRDIEIEKTRLEGEKANFEKAIEKIANNSFIASYSFKEGKRKEKNVTLDLTNRHRPKFVKTIEVNFVVPKNAVSSSEKTIVKLELKDSGGNNVSPAYTKDITVNDFKGKATIKLEKRLKTGRYYFLVTHKNEKINRYEFQISPLF